MVPITAEIIAAVERLLDADAALPPHKRMHAATRVKLSAIASGERKLLDVDWWRNIHGVAPGQMSAAERAKLDALEAKADPKRNPYPHEREVAARAAERMRSRKPKSAPGLEERDRAEAEQAEAARQWHERRSAELNEIWARMRRHPDNVAELERLREKARAEAAAKRVAAKAAREHVDTVRPAEPEPVTTEDAAGVSSSSSTKEEEPMAEPANAKRRDERKGDRHKPRTGDRHSAGYMRNYMRDYMRRRRAAARKGTPG
jgi:hypothetical protein